jgi:nucleoside phosphorylase
MILVTFALRQEGAVFENRIKQKRIVNGMTSGISNGGLVAVYWLGVGFDYPNRFEKIVTELKPALILNSGFAGAVDPALRHGDFLLAENATSPLLYERYSQSPLFDARGIFREVPAVIDSAGKARLRDEGQILAADMESDRVACLCRATGTPFLTARMVSDRFDEAIPGLFIGKGIRQANDIIDAVRFACRMLRLRKTLAVKLEDLILDSRNLGLGI